MLDYKEMFCGKSMEFANKYQTDLSNHPALFQRQRTSYTPKRKTETSFVSRSLHEYEIGFGNPYFDYYVGHYMLRNMTSIQVELKDDITKEIGRSIYSFELSKETGGYVLKLNAYGPVGGINSKGWCKDNNETKIMAYNYNGKISIKQYSAQKLPLA